MNIATIEMINGKYHKPLIIFRIVYFRQFFSIRKIIFVDFLILGYVVLMILFQVLLFSKTIKVPCFIKRGSF